MYYWNTHQLARDIKSNRVSAPEWKHYFIGVTLLGTVTWYVSFISTNTSTLGVLYELAISIIIFLWGIQKTYLTNLGDDGFDYVCRMIALAFPLYFKAMVYLAIFITSIEFTVGVMSFSSHTIEWLYTTIALSIQAMIFIRIDYHLAFINNP
ncbi:hypothetical protein [Vibrio sonorensis]|uniref:hypothetical protein n=1 Tax=Vibrio sonorensis TaxID=1004316 RepID=UPI0008DA4A15|nr:hypothetical protein [Vibrio sonorensis]